MSVIKRGDQVELFAVYGDRWISRGVGTVTSFVSDRLAVVYREGAHAVIAVDGSTETECPTVMVKEIPSDRFCQCLLPVKVATT